MIKIDLNNDWLAQTDENKLAIKTPGNEYSYRELKKQTNIIASSLTGNGFGENDYLPILLNDNLSFITTVYAAWSINAVPVPINTRLSVSEIKTILTQLKTSRVIVDKSIKIKELATIDYSSLLNGTAVTKKKFEFNKNRTALILFTSGTTGVPKGIIHTFSSLYKSVVNTDSITKTTVDDKWLVSLPFYHIGGFLIFLRALLTGSMVIVPQSLSTEDLLSSIKQDQPTVISLVPTMLKRLLDENLEIPESVKCVFVGGSASLDELIIKGLEAGLPLVKVYGSSETGAMLAAIGLNELRKYPSASGKAFENVEVIIDGRDGEILVKSESLFKGYINKQTSNIDEYGFYHTSDFGYIDINGYLYINSRREDLIITGGENVNPNEVESAIVKYSGVEEACVFSLNDEEWGQIVCAAIKCSYSLEKSQIYNFLKTELAGYKIPKQIFFVNFIPKTSLGKPQKEELKRQLNLM
ncbi:MAG: o-succinylbenzoate--CoA ligase [Melioribacteraceae bacterium]|nr:o-succinylbenzoate--CoA ligase [Melioribacteraceae bacterium]